MKRTGWIACAAVLLTGCAARWPVQVDAISDAGAPAAQTYVLKSAGDTKRDDLYWREFNRYAQAALASAGYRVAEDPAQADVEVVFDYGIGPGRPIRYTETFPVYDIAGGEVVRYTESVTAPDGRVSTRTGFVTIPMRTRVVGFDTHQRTYTLYTSHVSLQARSPGAQGKTLWRTTMEVTTDTNDPRRIVPTLLAAAVPYIGRNTGETITVKIGPKDPAVRALTGSAPN